MKSKKQLSWIIIALLLLSLFVLLQIPAVWLLKKFFPNHHLFQNVAGNAWQGQADWQYQQLQGSVQWRVQPWELLRLRAAAHVDIVSGTTSLQGVVVKGLGQYYAFEHFNGQIGTDTLGQLIRWQWPASAIRMKQLSVGYQPQQGFTSTEGSLSWTGGTLYYPLNGHAERIEIPPLVGQLTQTNQQLKLAFRDAQQQRMADLALDKTLMLDVQITQRFLLNAPSYQGKAGLDTAVISTRQPIMQIGAL